MNTEIQRRFSAVTDVRSVGDGLVELSFSSETPCDSVNHHFPLILSHAPDAVDLSRFIAGVSPLLFEHDRTQVIGIIERAWVDEATRKGRAVVRFGLSERAKDVARDVVARIRRGVSVGFEVLREVVSGRKVLATSWRPYEISICALPADTSIGIGRSIDSPPVTIQKNQSPMSKEMQALGSQRGALNKKIEAIKTRAAEAARDYTEDETELLGVYAGQIRSLSDRLNDAQARIESEYRREPLDGQSRSVHDDEGSYSIVRAMSLASQGRPLDGLEGEFHQESARNAIEAPRGFLVPLGALNRRDLTATGGTNGDQGGVTVAVEKGEIIDYLRASLAVRQLGATVLTGLKGNLDLPRVNAAANATWKAETAALDESSQTMDQLSLRPNRLGTFTEISRQLLIQSSPDIERWLRQDLANAIASAWEAAAIHGTGLLNQPLGILGTSGIGSVAGGTNGLAPTWANVVALESAVADANALQGSLGYLLNSKARGKLKTTIRNPVGTDSSYVWPDDSRLNGYPTAVSNIVPSNLTKGSGTGLSAIIFGNWADLVLAQWGAAADVIVNPYSRDVEGLVRIVISTFVDVGVRRPQSFAAMLDAITV